MVNTTPVNASTVEELRKVEDISSIMIDGGEIIQVSDPKMQKFLRIVYNQALNDVIAHIPTIKGTQVENWRKELGHLKSQNGSMYLIDKLPITDVPVLLDFIEGLLASNLSDSTLREVLGEVEGEFKKMSHVNIEGDCKYWKVEEFGYSADDRDSVNGKFFPNEVKKRIEAIINKQLEK